MAGDNLLMGLPPAVRSRARQFVTRYEDQISSLKRENESLLKRITRLENEARWHQPDLDRAREASRRYESSHDYLAYLSSHGYIAKEALTKKAWEAVLFEDDEDEAAFYGEDYEAPERGFADT